MAADTTSPIPIPRLPEPVVALDRPGTWAATPAFQKARLRAAAQGDARAWESIVGDYEEMVHGVARGFGLRPVEVGDAVQTTWLRLLENVDRIEHPERLGGWLATTARRECLRLAIRGQRAAPLTEREDAVADRVSTEPEVDEQLVALERQAAVRAAIRQLPTASQALLELLMADPPLSYAEISAKLDIPVGSIGPTRGRLLRKLAHLLAAEGISDGVPSVVRDRNVSHGTGPAPSAPTLRRP